MPLTGVFETTDGARGASSAPSRPIRCATSAPRSGCPTCRRAALRRPRQQVEHKAELHAPVPRALLDATRRAHWLARLEEQDLLCAPVRDMREALVDPADAVNNMMVIARRQRQRPQRAAEAASPRRSPWSARAVPLRQAPPTLGEQPPRSWPSWAMRRTASPPAHGQGAVMSIRFDVETTSRA